MKKNKNTLLIGALIIIAIFIFSNSNLFAVLSEYRDTLSECTSIKSSLESQHFDCTTCTQISDGRYKTSCDCESGYTYSNGVCIASTTSACTDTDSGIDRDTKGTVTIATGSYTDSCSGNYLTEYYCSGLSGTSTSINCGNYGEICYNGKCVESTASCVEGTYRCSPTQDGIKQRCVSGTWVDWSSDASCATTAPPEAEGQGLISGKVSDKIFGTPISFAKVTFRTQTALTASDGSYNLIVIDGGSDQVTVSKSGYNSYTDYVTAGPGIAPVTLNVQLQPESELSCYDTDQGENKLIKGTLYIGGVKKGTDSCASTTSVREYVCDLSTAEDYVIKTLSCGTGYECSDGRCIISSEATCYDTDGGQTKFTKGSVYVNDVKKATDACIGSTTLREYFCDSSDPAGYDGMSMSCGDGYECVDGRCKADVTTLVCEDTDGGQVYYTKGSIKINDVVKAQDACIGENTLREYFCDPSDSLGYDSLSKTCSDGCSNGECLPQSTTPPDEDSSDTLNCYTCDGPDMVIVPVTSQTCPFGYSNEPLDCKELKFCELEGEHILASEWTEQRCVDEEGGLKWCELENIYIEESEWTEERCLITEGGFSGDTFEYLPDVPDWVPTELHDTVGGIPYFWIMMAGIAVIFSYLLFTRKPRKKRRRK
ncbi:carboxypeptidase-like regulatory domain-containing protein [Candidatus Woesearchaeota archaeon]|nr:carboxypeptidase-like regulatory domain-containing protein [Candidatus Woesearchaeota archaeon]